MIIKKGVFIPIGIPLFYKGLNELTVNLRSLPLVFVLMRFGLVAGVLIPLLSTAYFKGSPSPTRRLLGIPAMALLS